VGNSKVTFTYRDRRKDDIIKKMTLEAEEFIRRFLLHILPEAYVRIRHFGFLANRSKKQHIRRCRELLGLPQQLVENTEKTPQESMLELTGIDITLCPYCKEGTMRVIREIPDTFFILRKHYYPLPQYMDSS